MDTMAFATPMRRALAVATLPLCILASTFAAEPAARAQSVTFGGDDAAKPAAAPATAPAAAPAPGPAAAPAGAPPDAPRSTTSAPEEADAEWVARERALGETNSLAGGTGLLHTQHATSGIPGQFRLAFTTEYFSAGFLCTATYPCPNPAGGTAAALTSDSMNHIGGTISASATITKWLEGYAATSAQANSDSANRPSLLQVLGDTDIGVKLFGTFGNVFSVAGEMELWLINGTGAVGLDGSGTSGKFRALATADLRGMESHVPLRFSLNTTYSLDNSGQVLQPTEAPVAQGGRGTSVTRIERFGLNVNRVDHFDLNLGAEYFAVDERIRPFIEYGLMIPINRQNYACKLNNVSHDNCLANDTIPPSKLTIGSRFFPWKHGFSLVAAFDIGVTGVANFVEEVAPTPPWTLYIGAGWAIDTRDRPPQVVTKVEKVGKVVGGHVKGSVHEKDKTEGVANAIVAFDNHPELTSLATGPDGRFTTQELPDGPYKFAIKADGFKDGTCETALARAADIQLDCPLEALPRVGTVVGHARDAVSGAPVANATVTVVDGQGKELRVSTDAQGVYRVENVPPGQVTVTVAADNYLSSVESGAVKVRQDNAIDIAVQPKPKNPLVQIGAREVNIKQQIQFALDSAVILPESFGLMTEIADALIRNPRIRKIEVQGHTDNSGTPEHNRVLSDQRANAVRDWLTGHGVQPDRLVAKGYGQDKPIVPNVTPAMKARNRRVQFIIMEQETPPALKP